MDESQLIEDVNKNGGADTTVEDVPVPEGVPTNDISELIDSIDTRLDAVENEYESKTSTLEANIQELTERYGTQEEGLPVTGRSTQGEGGGKLKS